MYIAGMRLGVEVGFRITGARAMVRRSGAACNGRELGGAVYLIEG